MTIAEMKYDTEQTVKLEKLYKFIYLSIYLCNVITGASSLIQ